MVYYSVVSAICILLMIALVIVLVVQFCTKNRAEKIEFIKSFKRGKCAIIYVVAIPMFFMASVYAGKSIGISIFDSISKAVYLVVLKYDVAGELFKANAVYASAIYICLTLVVLNAMMITISILHQAIWKMYRLYKFHHAKTNKCLIIGNNDKSLLVYDSCNCARLIVDIMKSSAQESLYMKGVSYKSSVNKTRLYEWVLKEVQKEIEFLKKTDKKLNIIVNCDSEKNNLDWCGQFLDLIAAADEDIAERIEIFVFGDREFEDIYSKYEEKAKGCLHYVNEYMQIAVDFIDRFPLTEYMGKTHIDYATTLVNPDTQINVTMIGFGRTNQQIFLSMVANNQFLTKDGKGNIVGKTVNYHLFDKLHTGGHKNLNHNYFRYRYDFFDDGKVKVDESKYLPLPEFPSSEDYHYLDVNDNNFYSDLEKSIDFGAQSINYIIVSIGLDYASIDMANKIVTKLKEWKLTNTQVFVRIREQKTFGDAPIFLDTDICHPFGTDKDVVYNYHHIIREKFAEMAIMRNYIYDIEHDMKHDAITEEERKISRLKWYIKRSTIERESNVYACLSLREKLHLMGLDYCKKDDKTKEGLSNDMFMSIYANGDMPDYVKDNNGEGIAVRYSLEYKDSRRKTMAIQEHCRWNAYMIMRGFVPSPVSSILTEVNSDGQFTNGKNYTMRRHGNLTTFDGLIKFRQMLAERDSLPEENYDVIKYDYQLLDGAWWLLNKNGFKIIRRNV